MRRIYELFRKAMGEDPFVRFYYQRYKRRHPKFHKYCKAASAVYALWLVFLFRLLGRDPRTRLVYPESSVCAHPSRKKMDRVLKKKDFVCFDGELLLLRRVSHIEKLWDAAGAKLGIADYKSMRRAAAAEADKKRKKGKAAWRRLQNCVRVERRGCKAASARRAGTGRKAQLCRPFLCFADLLSAKGGEKSFCLLRKQACVRLLGQTSAEQRDFL